MLRCENASRTYRKRLLALAAMPILLVTTLGVTEVDKIRAQTSPDVPAFKLPNTLADGTTIKVDGSSSMAVINEALKQRFSEKFPGAVVNLDKRGTDEALKALVRGEIDLAAVGRPLTDAEKSQGLIAVPISREKVAIIVGADNPFARSITSDQFAKIFRGEITTWSQLGGPAESIQMIDRPNSSDTRQALSQYPVFRKAPFKNGTNTTQVAEDDTAAVIKELGRNGIGYAIASQVINNGAVKILALHDTLPDDPRYPFSQPRGYVYRGTPNPGVQAYLGFATSKSGQEAVQAAKTTEAVTIASPSPVASPEPAPSPDTALVPAPATPAPTPEQPFPWWLLLLPLLGLPALFWWLKRGDVAPLAAAAPATEESRIILTPRNCRDAYAYWEAPDSHRQALRNQGGRNLALRLYDVTDIANMDRQTPHSMKQFECSETDCDRHLPIALDDRDYVVELGYTTNDGRWLKLARSKHVRVPACSPAERIDTAATAAVAATAATATAAAMAVSAAAATQAPVADSRIILVPRNDKDVYAYWEIPESRKAELKQQGGEKLMLRLHDVTMANQGNSSSRQYECSELVQDMHVPVVLSDRDYTAELGYLTSDNRWLSLATSAPVHVPSEAGAIARVNAPTEVTSPEFADDVDWLRTPIPTGDVSETATSRLEDATGTISNPVGSAGQAVANLVDGATHSAGAAIAGGAAAVAGVGAAAQSFWNQGRARLEHGSAPVADGLADDCRIILVPRNARDAYAYWEVADHYKDAIRQQGGRDLMLRIHDATNLDIDSEPPHATQEYPVQASDVDMHVAIPVSDRDYIAELGYYTSDRRWLRIIRSFHVHVPANQP